MKRIIIFISCLVIGFLTGCIINTEAKHDSPLNIYYESENGNFHVLRVVDNDTKVNYIVVETDLGGGYRGLSVCPRYNADGTLYTED